MSNHLSIRQTLERLEQFRAAVVELTAAGREAEADVNTRRTVETRRFAAQMAGERDRLDLELAQAVARYQQVTDALDRWSAQRKQRLQKAQRGSRRAALDRIDLEEGSHKYAVQKGTLNSERIEKEATAANESRYQEFLDRFGPQQQQWIALERRASASFRGYPGFCRALRRPSAQVLAELVDDENRSLDTAAILIGEATVGLNQFRRQPLPILFRLLPLWFVLPIAVLASAGAVWLLPRFGLTGLTTPQAGGAFGVGTLVLLVLFLLGRKFAAPGAARIADAVTRARHLQTLAGELAATHHAQERQRIATEKEDTRQRLEDRWHRAVGDARRGRDEWPQHEAEKVARANERWEALVSARRALRAQSHAESTIELRAAAESRLKPLIVEHELREARLHGERSARFQAIEDQRSSRLFPLWAELTALRDTATLSFPPWDPERWQAWRPPTVFGNAAPVGTLRVDLAQLCGGSAEELSRILPGPSPLQLPLVLVYPDAGSLLLETAKTGAEAAADCLNQVLLRLLAATPPGKVNMSIVDPVRLGQNFAGVMHLADFEENLINRRIWTQPAEIEQQLADLTGHMEKVIQMYLRNEYATIAEYNAQAGNIAERYRFLVVADFPTNFSDVALRRLVNIAASGARCGVYTLIHWDRQQLMPPEFVVESLRRNSVVLTHVGAGFALAENPPAGGTVQLIATPAPDLTTEFLRQVGTFGRDSGRVRVPFDQASPSIADIWSLETMDELRVPIGRTGATKLQYLALGKGTRQHALVAGKTGSGKSTLFHVMITNLALWCSPDQVEFYLVDFKKGVEFKCYGASRLPHARVVAIESDREFGLSVLQKLDDELRRRGDLFRQLGVQDLAGHHRATGGQPMPRALLLIDEFQEFFVEDDRVSQTAAVLLDRIVRQGRAFGIHVVLGSQTLGGAYTLARTTLGQMVVRIALQCNEADAFLIMDDTNPAPRLLTRPGEGIYNDMAGMVEGNSPFQTVWLDDQERDTLLSLVRRRADETGRAGLTPFVFEGNAPASVRDNADFARALACPPATAPASARLWLGSPNAIKGPTVAELRRQSGHHLLLIGQREDAELAIVSHGLLGLAAQFPPGTARFVLLDSTPPGSSQQAFLRSIVDAIPEPIITGRAGELTAIFSALDAELKRRTASPEANAPSTFVFLSGLQNFKQLMPEEDFTFSSGTSSQSNPSPATVLKDLLSGGPAVGLHVIATCDSYNNLNRYLGRKSLADFGQRVLFQMSANDSSSLIDNPKANTLGMHRALLHHDAEGWLETFRPYALPDSGWIREVKAALSLRHPV